MRHNPGFSIDLSASASRHSRSISSFSLSSIDSHNSDSEESMASSATSVYTVSEKDCEIQDKTLSTFSSDSSEEEDSDECLTPLETPMFAPPPTPFLASTTVTRQNSPVPTSPAPAPSTSQKLALTPVRRPLQRTFSYRTLTLTSSSYESEDSDECSSPFIQELYGLCPNQAQKSLDDLDGRLIYQTMSALLRSRN